MRKRVFPEDGRKFAKGGEIDVGPADVRDLVSDHVLVVENASLGELNLWA